HLRRDRQPSDGVLMPPGGLRRSLKTDRFGIRARLLLAFFGLCAIAILSTAAAIYAFLEVGAAVERITERRLPVALAALQLSRQAERVTGAAPALLAAASSAQREEVSKVVAQEMKRLEDLLPSLKKSGFSVAPVSEIDTAVPRLTQNLTALDTLVKTRL